MTNDLISRQTVISAICNACGKIDCDKMDKCEKLQLPPANSSEFPNNSDTISRQAAIDALKEHRALYCDNTPDTFSKLSYAEKSRVDELDTAIATIVNLPSAEPKRGKWIDAVIPNDNGDLFVQVCDQCNTFFPLAYTGGGHHFCPNCGARMKGGEDSEND